VHARVYVSVGVVVCIHVCVQEQVYVCAFTCACTWVCMHAHAPRRCAQASRRTRACSQRRGKTPVCVNACVCTHTHGFMRVWPWTRTCIQTHTHTRAHTHTHTHTVTKSDVRDTHTVDRLPEHDSLGLCPSPYSARPSRLSTYFGVFWSCFRRTIVRSSKQFRSPNLEELLHVTHSFRKWSRR